VASGSLNLFQYFSYIITIALYATGFAAVSYTHLSVALRKGGNDGQLVAVPLSP